MVRAPGRWPCKEGARAGGGSGGRGRGSDSGHRPKAPARRGGGAQGREEKETKTRRAASSGYNGVSVPRVSRVERGGGSKCGALKGRGLISGHGESSLQPWGVWRFPVASS